MNVTFRVRVFLNDVTEVALVTWNDYSEAGEVFEMTKDAVDPVRGYEWWKYTLPAPSVDLGVQYWYHFRIRDGVDTDMYADDSAMDARVGRMYEDISYGAEFNYLLAVPDSVDTFAFYVDSWKFF